MFRMDENELMNESLELKDETGANSSDSDIQILDDDNGNDPGENESFVVDTSAQQEIDANAGLDSECFNSSNIISHVYNGPDKNGERKSKERRFGQACFNCNSLEHPARDCPHPPNQRRISQNRNSFIKRREGSGRFHEDATEKAKEIVPGKISHKLREALDIGGRELPEWIYRMRRLGHIDGYPPGYRKIAIEEPSIFEFHEGTSSTNRKRKHASNNHLEIARDKIIKYPGFNYDDGNYIDKRENYRIPQFDEFINKQETYLIQMKAIEESQIKKRKTNEGNSAEINLIEDEEDNLDVLIVKTRRSSESIEDGEIRENDHQIIEEEEEIRNITIRMKKKKKNKSKKLETNASQSSKNNANSKNVEPEVENKNEKLNEDEEDTIPIMETSIPLIENEDLQNSQQNGNEIIKPSLDNFAQGIQPFQHQSPDKSTGFIKRLHDIIKKTRKN